MERVMRRTISRGQVVGMLLALLAVAVWATGCDSVDTPAAQEAPDNDVLAAFSADLVEAVPLSQAAGGQVNGVLRRHQQRIDAPGFLWYVAEGLQKTLSEEQKARMFAMFERNLAQGFGHGRRGNGQGEGLGAGPGHRFGGPGGAGEEEADAGRGWGPMGPLRIIADLLTDEQKEQLKAMQESHQEAVRAVLQSARAGEITREEAAEQVKALRDALKVEVEAILTDEQKAALEERIGERQEDRQERREQALAARNDALGLTEAEAAALDALLAAHREAMRELRESIGEGSMDREEVRAAVAELRKSHFEEVEALLTDEQIEIIKIHHVLRVRWAHVKQARAKMDGLTDGPFGAGPFGRRR